MPRLRGIAVSGAKRLAAMPDIPRFRSHHLVRHAVTRSNYLFQESTARNTCMRTLASITVLGLVGCATPTTDVVPTKEGLYTVTRQGEGASVTTADLRAAAIVEGTQYCATKQMAMKVVQVKEIPMGVLSRGPRAEV